MRHQTFEHIKGIVNILVDRIFRLRSMGLYDMQNPEERGKEFEHFMSDEQPPITTKQEKVNSVCKSIQHVPHKVRL